MSTFLRTVFLSLFKITQFGLVVLGSIELAEWADWPPSTGRKAGIVFGLVGLWVPHLRHQSINPDVKRRPASVS